MSLSPNPKRVKLSPQDDDDHMVKRECRNTSESIPEAPGYLWDKCGGLDDANRLATKEEAIRKAEEYLDKLAHVIHDAVRKGGNSAEEDIVLGTSYLTEWLSKHEELVAQSRSYAVLVGVEGPTGAGKSSLLGCLLRIKDLLPSGHERAATAVSAKVSWNYDTRPGYEYRAEVKFRPRRQLENQIFNLLSTILEIRTLEREDYEDEDQKRQDIADLHAQVEHDAPVIQAVWYMKPAALKRRIQKCKTEDDLRLQAKRIIESCPGPLGLMESGTLEKRSSNPKDLADAIKPFLDTSDDSHGHSKNFCAWPLVESVDVYARAEILKSGIQLVDLPGCGDAVHSRVEVAEKFSKLLDIRMVVTPICRAADEREGRSLMTSRFHEAQMKMDGKFNSASLCVVLSKIDALQVEQYIDAIPELRKNPELKEKRAQLLHLKECLKNLGSEGLRLECEKKEADKLELKISIELTNSGGLAVKRDQGNKFAARRLQKLQSDRHAAKERCKTAISYIEMHKEKRQAINSKIKILNDDLYHRANFVRSQRVKEQIHDSFRDEQEEDGFQIDFEMNPAADSDNDEEELPDEEDADEEVDESTWLPIFPVSSSAFWKLHDEEEPLEGFPHLNITGVPGLEQWLQKATLCSREQHLNTVLSQYRGFMNELQNYSLEINRDIDVGFSKQEVEAALAQAHKSFEADIEKKIKEWAGRVDKIQPFKDANPLMSKFHQSSKKVVASWLYRYPENPSSKEHMNWATQKAILKRGGAPFESNSKSGEVRTYTWIENLAEPLLASIATKWDASMNGEICKLSKPVAAEFCDLWERYINELMFSIKNHVPSLETEFGERLPALKEHQNTAENTITNTYRGFSKDAAKIHPEIIPIFYSITHKVFDAALGHTGQGSLKRRHEHLVDHLTKGKRHKELSKQTLTMLTDGVKRLKANFPAKLRQISDDAVKTVKKQVSCLLNNLLDNDDEGSSIQGKKAALHRDIRKLLMEWDTKWRFHRHSGDHVLLQDYSVSENIQDVLGIKEEDLDRDIYQWHEDLDIKKEPDV